MIPVRVSIAGSSVTNPGVMGFAAIIKYPEVQQPQHVSGKINDGTSNRAIIRAAILGLSEISLYPPEYVIVNSTSEYLVGGVTGELRVDSNDTDWIELRELTQRFPNVEFVLDSFNVEAALTEARKQSGQRKKKKHFRKIL